MSETEAATSSTETAAEAADDGEKLDDFAEPDVKRRKLTSKNADVKKNKLEERLGGILCCAVCLDLPRAAVYQGLKKTGSDRYDLLFMDGNSLLVNLPHHLARVFQECNIGKKEKANVRPIQLDEGILATVDEDPITNATR